ncbi:hypothetical protein [Kineococcus sp. SYSU DK005]|uniref:hypothetical protein n=1 Tax=Kineococcus sp. SYSU DK005 TaxID=3383126 RepID=UPI003D7EBF9D
MSTHDAAAARTHAEQAAATAAKLKPGTWEAVQALALTSIAHSLAALADARDGSRPSSTPSSSGHAAPQHVR